MDSRGIVIYVRNLGRILILPNGALEYRVLHLASPKRIPFFYLFLVRVPSLHLALFTVITNLRSPSLKRNSLRPSEDVNDAAISRHEFEQNDGQVTSSVNQDNSNTARSIIH